MAPLSFIPRRLFRLALLASLAALLAVPLAGCAPGAGLPPLPPAATSFRLGPEDQVRVIVFGEDQLTGEFRVGVPLLGSVPAAGRTPDELGAAIAARLRRGGVLRDPSVSVEVIDYRPIFVLGEVNHPGQFPYQPRMTLVTAVAVAGGFTYRAVQDQAAIMRSVDGAAIEGKATRDTYVQPGDVITVFERRF
jgi:polysaccharide export outer membrane protein